MRNPLYVKWNKKILLSGMNKNKTNQDKNKIYLKKTVQLIQYFLYLEDNLVSMLLVESIMVKQKVTVKNNVFILVSFILSL